MISSELITPEYQLVRALFGNLGKFVRLLGGRSVVVGSLSLSCGALYVGCYEPSQICRVAATGEVEVVVHDVDAHTLCHPTDVAFVGDILFTTNLGRWHITAVNLSSLLENQPPS